MNPTDTEIDTSIEAYSLDELYELVSLPKSSTEEEIEEHFKTIIQGSLQAKNYILAQFFHNAKEKMINSLSQSQSQSQSQSESLNPNNIKIIYTNVAINSKDRPNQIPLITNPSKLNSPVNFIVSLTEPLINVISIKLESINIPNTIMTFDPLYSNNTIYIYTTDSSANGVPDFTNSTPTIVNITPGTYTKPIDFINQINLDLSYCAPPELKYDSSGNKSTGTQAPYSGSLVLQAHLVAPLTKNPRSIFINGSKSFVKIVYYELRERNSGLPSVGVLDNEDNPCYIKSVYNNNLGYFMGYRIYEEVNGKILNYIENTENGIKYVEFGIILAPAPEPLVVQTKLTSIYNSLLRFDLEYSYLLYSDAIYSFITTNVTTTSEFKFYSISSVPLNLYATKYVYLCINDFQNNRASGTIIRVSDPITKIYPLPEYVNKLTNYPQDPDVTEIDINADIYCDLIGKTKVYVPSWPRKITQNQMYSLNAILENNRKIRTNINDNYITDVLATIPVDPAEQSILVSFTKYRPRFYFGPVRIEKLEIKLKDETGKFVNLNGVDWGFSIIVEQVYQN